MSVDGLVDKVESSEKCVEEGVYYTVRKRQLSRFLPGRVHASWQYALATMRANLSDVENPLPDEIAYKNCKNPKMQKKWDDFTAYFAEPLKKPLAYSSFAFAFAMGFCLLKYSQKDGGYSFIDRNRERKEETSPDVIRLAG